MNNTISLTDIAQGLGATASGSGYKARCPAHNDEHASLALNDDSGGKVLVKCHAGCRQEDVIDALRQAGLWTPAPELRTIAGCYDYKDADGKVIYQKVRYQPKGFSQRRPDGHGGWIYKLDGVEQIPYRLPELLAAIAAGSQILIAEGEKDCDNLANRGLCATTNSGGAGKWSDSLSRYLKGAMEVIVLPDNDKPGRDHAQQVAASITRAGVPVKVVTLPDLPDKGDVSDWLKAGGTKEQLLELSAAATSWTPSPEPPKSGARGSEQVESDWSDPETFGEPIMFGEIETPEITSDFLPSWVKEYVDAVAASTQTPVAMASMLALSTLAACVQKRFVVCPYGDDYSEPLGLWVLVAMPPASRKTSVLDALRTPIKDWEKQQEVMLEPLIKTRTTQRQIAEKRIEELTRQASKQEH